MDNKKRLDRTVLEVMFDECIKNSQFSIKQIALYLGIKPEQITKWTNGEEHIEPAIFERIMDLLGYPSDTVGKSTYLPKDVDFKNTELTKEDLDAIARTNRIYSNLVYNKSI